MRDTDLETRGAEQPHFVHACGQRLEYRFIGPPPAQAPTVVLLHEGLGCAEMWRDFPQRLNDALGWGVCAYSRAGYGRSSPCALPRPTTFMHDEALRVLPEVLDGIGFRQGVLLGHSDGASIAAIHAGGVDDPRVRASVLMAPHFFTEEMGLAEIARAREAYRHTDLRARLARYHGENVDLAFRGWSDAWLDPAFRAWDIQDYARRIEMPLLLIQGVDDQYGTLAQIEAARRLARGPVETAVLEACRHSPHRDQPQATLDAICAFARGLGSGEAATRRA